MRFIQTIYLVMPLLTVLACSFAPTVFPASLSSATPLTQTSPTNTPPPLPATATPEPPSPTATVPVRDPITLPISIYILDDDTGQISSQRTSAELEDVYEKVNEIWDQAGIVLEVQIIERVTTPPGYLQAIASRDFQQFFAGVGSDIQLTEPGLLNGFYAYNIGGPNGITPFNSRVFFVTDEPSVHDERVTSHEIGHILGLHHVLDDPNRLMFSGTNGMLLSEEEVVVARYAARGLLAGVR